MKSVPIVFSLYNSAELSRSIVSKTGFESGKLLIHSFPDMETVVTIQSDVIGRDIILIVGLDDPNSKALPLIFAAETLRSLGAKNITLVAPYLPYMRQDAIFEIGQGITSHYFAKLISQYFDKLITIDPHLHRTHALADIYSIPNIVLHASNSIAQWIKLHIQNPVLIGPDSESLQWVEAIATLADAPYTTLNKIRKNDTDISVSLPDISQYHGTVPILVDDIISTGMTMLATINHLKNLHSTPPICIGVHGIFAQHAYENLLAAGAQRIVTCNTLSHPSNAIDISAELITALES